MSHLLASLSLSGQTVYFGLPRVATNSANLMPVLDGRTAFVPEGQANRSLARSAWDNATLKSRPVGYGVIRAGKRADSE
jgi:hypothetical protein